MPALTVPQPVIMLTDMAEAPGFYQVVLGLNDASAYVHDLEQVALPVGYGEPGRWDGTSRKHDIHPASGMPKDLDGLAIRVGAVPDTPLLPAAIRPAPYAVAVAGLQPAAARGRSAGGQRDA